MSQGRYFKFVSHIITDSENAASIAKKIQDGLDTFIKSVYGSNADEASWQSFKYRADNTFYEITAEFNEVVGGSAPEENVQELLSEIDALENGSYGLLLADSDYGVMEYRCYGNAKFVDVPETDVSGFEWSSGDVLCLEKSFTVEELAEILGCSAEDACDEAEDRANEIAEKLLPDSVFQVYESDEDLFSWAEVDEMDGSIRISLMFNHLFQTTDQLLALKATFSDDALKGWTLRLSEAEGSGTYKNIMICPEYNAVIEFETAESSFGACRYMVMQ